MQSLFDIAKLPTVVNNVHQSVYRAAAILQMTKELLEAGVPAPIILSLIAQVEQQPKVEEVYK